VRRRREPDPASPVACLGGGGSRDPFYLLGRADMDKFTFADLARLRFAIVSEVPTPWMCLQHDLRRHGVDPERLVRVTDRTMAENFAALDEGRIDIIQVFEPFVSTALEVGAGRVLYAASARGPTVYTSFIARRDAIAR